MAPARPEPVAPAERAAVAAELAAIRGVAGPGVVAGLELAEARLARIAAAEDVPAPGGRLAESAASTLAAGGKRLRPLLVFLCAPDRPGAAASDALVRAAAAVELVHMAALLHDDVLDRAPLRRGLPTVFARDGRGAATAAGDFLFARAFAELARTGDDAALRLLSEAASALVRGELMQRADAWSAQVTRERYLERCELKTASLFAAASSLGALLGGRGEPAAARLGDFGRRIGLAFQILDDVLDVAGAPEQTGKPIGTDLLDGTVTLPLILARERDPSLASADLRALESGADAAALCERIAATGALEQARDVALEHVATAKRALAGTGLEGGRMSALELVADGVAERQA